MSLKVALRKDHVSDRKAPTYEYRSPVGRAFTVRRFIFLRSDIFKRWWCDKDVGPEGADLQRAPFFREATWGLRFFRRLGACP
jgi:hypothetical protein